MQTLPSELWPFLKKILRPYRWRVAFVLLTPVFMALENNAMPYALKLLVDQITRPDANHVTIWNQAWIPVALYLGVLGCMLILFRVREWIMLDLQPNVQASIREALFDHVTQHSHRFFAEHFAGAIAAKVNDLARAVNTMKDFICWRMVTAISVNVIAIVLIASVHWAYALLVGGWALLHLALSHWLGSKVNRYADANAEDRAALSGMIVDAVSNHTSLRLFARHAHESAVMRRYQGAEMASQRRMLKAIMRVRLVLDIPIFIMYGALFISLIYGWQIGAVTAGDMVYIMFATFLVLEQTWMLGVDFPGFVSELGSARNALKLVTTPLEITDHAGARPLRVSNGMIEYKHVSFRYRKTTPLFSDLSVRIAPGEKLGLVGFSGSGKSTFVNVLMRLYDVQEGAITIDNQAVNLVTQQSLHEAIAFIPQDTSLFHRSLRDNIAYGKPDASDEEITRAATLADCAGFIDALPQGYDTLVGERGVKLSGGQRQRIALARAILKDAPILVLDEATSALDSVTEAAIQKALSGLMEGRTTIVIAHRLATLNQMDRILVFDNGRIIEEGSHEALLAMGGHYAKMWHMQAGGFLPEQDQ